MKLKLKKKEIHTIQEALRIGAFKSHDAFVNCDMIRLLEKLQFELDKNKKV